MGAEPPWVKVSQQVLETRAMALDQPLWLKVALLAYARVQANGCANFRRNELAQIFDVDHRQAISRAIRLAVGYGWLREESCSECLVPPCDFVEMSFGNRHKGCPVHAGSVTFTAWGKRDQERAEESPQVTASR